LRRALWLPTLCAAALFGVLGTASASGGALPAIRHVFIIVLENESASTTFAPNSPAPYLAKTLTSEGAYLPNYYGTGHESNDNYISLISGQAPNPENQGDCQIFDNFEPDVIGAYGQAIGQGCVFPADVKTIADQLDDAGLTWRDYDQSMGATPSREPSVCAHPGINQQDGTQTATAADQYATRHNPFVYFHSIIDNTALCDSHVVNLDLLPQDLASEASTPNYVFITPDLCSDGHDATCADSSRPGGFAGIDQFLEQWVPKITGSPAFRHENGLLAIIFDEGANASDSGSCCGEIAGPNSPMPGINGAGGGDTGAVLLSPCIKPGTVSKVAYNHYTLLRSVEDLFGLKHLGYADLPGEQSLGSDVFNRPCQIAPAASLRAPPLASSVTADPQVALSWGGTGTDIRGFTLQVEQTSSGGGGWQTLLDSSTRQSLSFSGRDGATYQFRLQAIGANGLTSTWATATTVFPSRARVPGAHYLGKWRLAPVRDAWNQRALVGSHRAGLTLSYVGGAVELIGDMWPQSGRVRVTVDGRSQVINLRSARPRARQVIYQTALATGRHRLAIRVLSGLLPLEGVAISARQR
jgi:phosphatidylinositol-3-phosphatase